MPVGAKERQDDAQRRPATPGERGSTRATPSNAQRRLASAGAQSGGRRSDFDMSICRPRDLSVGEVFNQKRGRLAKGSVGHGIGRRRGSVVATKGIPRPNASRPNAQVPECPRPLASKGIRRHPKAPCTPGHQERARNPAAILPCGTSKWEREGVTST